MTKDDLRIILARELCKRSFYNFFKYFWGIVESSEFVDNYHIKMVCDILQKRFLDFDNIHNTINDGDILLNLPPGSTKSLIVSEFFPAWMWLIRPTTKIITYSYSFKIAEELSSKSLKILTNEKYIELVDFKMTSVAVTNLKNSRGGQRFVTSTGGAITGFHADVILGDDPNGPSNIYSAVERLNAKRFVNEILPSRKTSIKRSFVVTVQQRLHQEDISGVILENKTKLKHVKISAIDENGNSFFPSRFPIDFLSDQKEKLGTLQFNAQYLQLTQDEDGGIIKKDWIQEVSGENKVLTYFIDSAYGGKNADYNAILGVYKDGNNLVLQSLEINKFEFPELLNWLKSNIPQHSKVYIEGKASGKSIVQTLKQQTNFLIIEVGTSSGKIERKHSISPYFESGRVFINKYIKYKDKLIEQLVFDQTKNDDISDVVTMAVEELVKKNNSTKLRFI